MSESAEQLSPEDEMIATLSDYLDGALPADRRKDVEAKLASDAEWKRTHDEMRETRDNLSGLLKARAPEKFDREVTETIHKRSAGRFFAKRTFGDRIPLGVLLVIGLVILIAIGAMMWSSSSGSVKRDKGPTEPVGSGAVVDKP
jgi:anti-sigma factor RsiW